MEVPIVRTIQALTAGYGWAAQAPLEHKYYMYNLSNVSDIANPKDGEHPENGDKTLVAVGKVIEEFRRSWDCITPLYPLNEKKNFYRSVRGNFRESYLKARDLFLARARFWKYLKQESAFAVGLTALAYFYKPNPLLTLPGGGFTLLCACAHWRRSCALDRALAAALIHDAHLKNGYSAEVDPEAAFERAVRLDKTLTEWRKLDPNSFPAELVDRLGHWLPCYDWDELASND